MLSDRDAEISKLKGDFDDEISAANAVKEQLFDANEQIAALNQSVEQGATSLADTEQKVPTYLSN